MIFSFFKKTNKKNPKKYEEQKPSTIENRKGHTAVATGKNDVSLPDMSPQEKGDNNEEHLDNLVFEYSFAESVIYTRYLEYFKQRRQKDKGNPLNVFEFLDNFKMNVEKLDNFKDFILSDFVNCLNDVNDYIESLATEETVEDEDAINEEASDEDIDASEENDKEDLDPIYYIKKSDDNMSAYLLIIPNKKGGKAVTLEDCIEALKNAEITYGIDEATIKSIITKKNYFSLFQIALGTPPANGKDGEVIEHYPRKIKIVFKEDEFGNTDFKNFGNVQNITKGSVICDIVMPTLGVNGCDILGNTLEAIDGEMPIIPMGENTILSEDETQLLADSDGCVNYHDGMFYVRQLLYIKGNVGPHTGNLDFKGDVHVEGDVRDGYNIKADGNIKIQGTVENSSVTAGGGISISGGVKGNEKAVLTAGSEIKSLFFENCTVKSKNGVYSESIINCNIYTDEQISVDRGKGSIIGGSLIARTYIQSKIIGNQTGKTCIIKLGTNYNLAEEKLNLSKEIEELEETLRMTRKDLLFFEKSSQSGDKKSQYLALKGKAGLYANQIRIKQKKLNDIITNGFDIGNCFIRAREIFPPINITIGTHNTIIRMPYFSAKCYYSPSKEEFRIINYDQEE